MVSRCRPQLAICENMDAEPALRETEGGLARAVSQTSEWASLAPDVLTHIAGVLRSSDVLNMFLTCTAWNRGVKSQLVTLTPWYLDRDTVGPHFSGVTHVNAPLHRSRLHDTVSYIAPIQNPALLNQFPRLLHLDLSEQDLPEGLLCWFGHVLPHLQLLTLSSCRLTQSDLFGLHSLANLRTLNLQGVRLFPLMDTDASTRFLAGLRTLTALASLNFNMITCLREVDASGTRIWRRVEDGLPLLGACAQLAQISHLSCLLALRNRLSAADITALRPATQLRTLHVSWIQNDRSLRLGMEAWEALVSHTGLTELNLQMFSSSREKFSLSPLTCLEVLTLTACTNLHLVLSIRALKRLRQLDLSGAAERITPELIVEVVRGLPHLTQLVVNHSRCTLNLELAGDVLVRGLATFAPQLQVLKLEALQMHGTGFHPQFSPQGVLFPNLRELLLSGVSLLRSKYTELAGLSKLQSLTITGVSVSEFTDCSRLNCYRELSRLSALTALRLLGKRSESVQPPQGAPLREPHLHFLTRLARLQVLELGAIESDGVCFRLFGALTCLKVLHMEGTIVFTSEGLSCLAACRLPALQSLKLLRCVWKVQPPILVGGISGPTLIPNQSMTIPVPVPQVNAGVSGGIFGGGFSLPNPSQFPSHLPSHPPTNAPQFGQSANLMNASPTPSSSSSLQFTFSPSPPSGSAPGPSLPPSLLQALQHTGTPPGSSAFPTMFMNPNLPSSSMGVPFPGPSSSSYPPTFYHPHYAGMPFLPSSSSTGSTPHASGPPILNFPAMACWPAPRGVHNPTTDPFPFDPPPKPPGPLLTPTCPNLCLVLANAMPGLTHLELGDCNGLTEAALLALGRLPCMQHLHLHRQPLRPSCCQTLLEPCTQLRTLECLSWDVAPQETKFILVRYQGQLTLV